jgi:hypothetical protein
MQLTRHAHQVAQVTVLAVKVNDGEAALPCLIPYTRVTRVLAHDDM